tara:strand:- start:165 stop:1256 length:1092 start_codon:yes stop_codon:yes gene_type:complete
MAIDKIESAGLATNTNQPGLRNIMINGDMSIAQRSTSVSSITGSGYNTVDRIHLLLNSLGTWTQSQSTTVPTGQGFATSLKMDNTTADASPSSGDYCIVRTKFEGQMLQYLKKGTSSAESTTLSFWVRSNKTGTYIAELYDADNTRNISKSYTISSADTWEKKTITYDGDTTGALDNNNALSLSINFWLGAGTDYTSGTLATSWASATNANRAVGQVNLADSTSNEWYITGVQLEAGTSASDFEFLPVDANFMRCFRYYYKYADGNNSSLGLGVVHHSNQMDFVITFPTQMRANPTVDQVTGTDYYQFYHNTGDYFNGIDSIQDEGKNQQTYLVSSNISASANECGIVYGANASAYMAADAEL